MKRGDIGRTDGQTEKKCSKSCLVAAKKKNKRIVYNSFLRNSFAHIVKQSTKQLYATDVANQHSIEQLGNKIR